LVENINYKSVQYALFSIHFLLLVCYFTYSSQCFFLRHLQSVFESAIEASI
jgi:hypothetical protein